MNLLLKKFREVTNAVVPIYLIVLLLDLLVLDIDRELLIKFTIGSVLLFLGLSIFLFGVENGVTPVGNSLGSRITRSNNLYMIVLAGLSLGFIVSIAEPDLHILAGQVDLVTMAQVSKLNLLVVVSIGIALMMVLALIRIIRNIPLYIIMFILYGIIFLLTIFVPKEFLAIAFDASGATTGAMTVPFLLAISYGVSSLKKDSKAGEKDSLGMIGIVSAGAIIAVLLLGIFSGVKLDSNNSLAEHGAAGGGLFFLLGNELGTVAFEVLLALLPILLTFLIFVRDQSAKVFRRHLKGLLYTYIGLVLFLTGVNFGFLELGRTVGEQIASLDNQYILVAFGFILGLVTILAEPAAYVLTNEIDDITGGYVPRRLVLLTLAIGKGLAISLAMLRIVMPEIQLWHYLLPGYTIALLLTLIVPKLFVGIAFDSGGVAAGPMTATFILAFTQGAASVAGEGNVLLNGFGLISLVALTPLIVLQLLGLVFKIKSKKEVHVNV